MRRAAYYCLAGLLWAGALEAHTFTDTKGRSFVGEIKSATADDVTIRRSDGRVFTVKLDVLSDLDQQEVAAFLTAKRDKEMAAGAAKEAEGARKSVVEYVLSKIGTQVGNGECWTLANEAFKHCEISRPSGAGGRVWGREIDLEKDEPAPGDIVEIEAAEFSNGMRFAEQHTSVVVDVGRRGKITVCECNISGNKTVQERDYDLRGIKSGTVKLYRYEGKE